MQQQKNVSCCAHQQEALCCCRSVVNVVSLSKMFSSGIFPILLHRRHSTIKTRQNIPSAAATCTKQLSKCSRCPKGSSATAAHSQCNSQHRCCSSCCGITSASSVLETIFHPSVHDQANPHSLKNTNLHSCFFK